MLSKKKLSAPTRLSESGVDCREIYGDKRFKTDASTKRARQEEALRDISKTVSTEENKCLETRRETACLSLVHAPRAQYRVDHLCEGENNAATLRCLENVDV